MKTIDDIRAVLAVHAEELRSRYGVGRLSIFGSYARNEQHEGSDLDLLVDFEGRVGLMRVNDLQYCLEDILGMRVDVVTPKALKPFMSERILNEAVAV